MDSMDAPHALLVEVNPGEFAVFGGLSLEGVHIDPTPLLPESARRSFEGAVATAISTGNLSLQVASALGSFEGLVRLSPATLEAMKAGATPLSNGAFNLGSLTDASGHIVHSVQWASAGAVGAASALAAIGPALAIMAIQMQLAKITGLVRENLRLSDALLEELRTDRWATVEGHHAGMLDMMNEARTIGVVNDHIWQNVSGNELALQSIRASFRRNVDRHLTKMRASADPVALREFLDHHGDAVIADVQGLLQAQAAWFTYQAVRAGHIHFTIETDPTAPLHLVTVVANAREQHERDLRDISELVDALLRRASAMVDAKDSGTIPFGKKRRAARDVARAAKVLRDQLNALHTGWNITDPPVPTPLISAFEGGQAPEDALRVLRWHLEPQEVLLALASVRDQSTSQGVWDWKLQDDWLYTAVTDKRILVAKKKELTQNGEIVGAIPLNEVRFVRYRPGSLKPAKVSARLDVVTKNRDLILKFPEWAGHEMSRQHVDSFAQLLQSAMCLPTEDVPDAPVQLKSRALELGWATSSQGED